MGESPESEGWKGERPVTSSGVPDDLVSLARTETIYDLWACLGEAGIPPPPIPFEALPFVTNRGKWHWATFDVDPLDLFVLRPFVEWAVCDWDRKPAFLFGRYDSITSPPLLTLFVARGPIAVLAQHTWRDPEADPMWAAADVAWTYEATRILLEKVAKFEPPARNLLHVASAQNVFTLSTLPVPSERRLPEPAQEIPHAPHRYDSLDDLFAAAVETLHA